MNLSIICVNWNSLDYLRECIPSIYEYTSGISFEIIVVDNASPEGGAELLKEEFPGIFLIQSKDNLGFAGANNLGFKYSTGDYILLLNPDTKLISPAINLMLQTSCIMLFPTISNTVFQSEFFRMRWPKLFGIGPLYSKTSKPAKVEAVSGACMLVKREVFDRVGMFSEDYFMYAEDLDLCFKVSRAGLTNYYLGDGVIIHYAGKSSAPEWQIVAKLKSDLRFLSKNYGSAYATAFRAAMIFNAGARLMLVNVVSTFHKMARKGPELAEVQAKWNAILKTLLSSADSSSDTVRNPKPVSDPDISKV
jgi:N-acetylglucosaminyl-diphospho-decaprenol L-rhamnosyltransferase